MEYVALLGEYGWSLLPRCLLAGIPEASGKEYLESFVTMLGSLLEARRGPAWTVLVMKPKTLNSPSPFLFGPSALLAASLGSWTLE